MKSLSLTLAVFLGLVLLAAAPSRSATVNHIANPGTQQDITDISGFMTTGEDMGGMRVTAHFTADLMGASETVNWNPGALGSGMGSAVGTGWRLDESGDTWNSLWRLSGAVGTNLTLFGLTIEGFMPSDDPVSVRATIFDRTDPFFGTDGSYRGRDLDAFAMAGTWSHVRVVYFDQVNNLADPVPGPHGDVYRAMQLQFGQVIPIEPFPIFEPLPFVAGDELLYLQDTDTVGERVPGDPGEESAPEPTGLILAVLGACLALQFRWVPQAHQDARI